MLGKLLFPSFHPPKLLSLLPFFHSFKSSSSSTCSFVDKMALLCSVLVHPSPIGLACLLCSLSLYFLFSLFFFLSPILLFLFFISFFFPYVPPACTWQWLHIPGSLSIRVPPRQFNFLFFPFLDAPLTLLARITFSENPSLPTPFPTLLHI